ncbi:hypothetical protein [Paenarthrobacter nitroguajacolicus]
MDPIFAPLVMGSMFLVVGTVSFWARRKLSRMGAMLAAASHLVDLNTIESKTPRASLVSSGLIDSWNVVKPTTARSPFRLTTR